MFLDSTKLTGFYIAGAIRAWLTKYTNEASGLVLSAGLGIKLRIMKGNAWFKSCHYWFRTFGVPPFGSTPALFRRQHEADYFLHLRHLPR
jgi:hypothetical protein